MSKRQKENKTPKMIGFYNKKGGVGKTYSLIQACDGLVAAGKKVLLVDLDPQCNLTEHYMPEWDYTYPLSQGEREPDVVSPIMCGQGCFKTNSRLQVNESIYLVAGHINSDFLVDQWMLYRMEPYRRDYVIFFHGLLKEIADTEGVDVVLVDFSPASCGFYRFAMSQLDYLVCATTYAGFSKRGVDLVIRDLVESKGTNTLTGRYQDFYNAIRKYAEVETTHHFKREFTYKESYTLKLLAIVVNDFLDVDQTARELYDNYPQKVLVQKDNYTQLVNTILDVL